MDPNNEKKGDNEKRNEEVKNTEKVNEHKYNILLKFPVIPNKEDEKEIGGNRLSDRPL
jgi:hypothetical protein